jgi:NAD-dependent dihydropyrimidine dehydrogenase PreA subunit
MNPILRFFSWLFLTLLRLFPFPVKPGLVIIGSPGPRAPVFVTGNYLLSVRRLKQGLQGIDAYILVANTHGINIWCGAAGGHFTHHSVISALITSGIEDRVQHRQVILPQLAATGVEAQLIHEKTGWSVIWGPVDAKDLRDFLQNNQTKNEELRTVTFSLFHRIEMALSWAFPISLFMTLPVLIIVPNLLIFSQILIWGLCLVLLAGFPVYSGFVKKRENSLWLFILQGILFIIVTAGFVGFYVITGTPVSLLARQRDFLPAIILIFVIVVLISIDLKGLTPLFHSGFLDKQYTITHNTGRCKGEGTCIAVCPKNCFQRIKEKPGIIISSPGTCMACGACIVQCPYNALCFTSPGGGEIPPEEIRKYKLTLMGKKKETIRR